MTVRTASGGERQFWTYEQLHPGQASTLVVGGFEVHGVVDPADVHGATTALVDRHEILRSAFRRVGGDVEVVQHPGVPVHVEVGTAIADDFDHAIELARRLAWREIALERPPLLRTALVSWAPDRHILAVSSHHAVLDGASLGIVARELGQLLDPAGDDLPTPFPLSAVREEEEAQRAGGAWDVDIAYWCNQLATVRPRVAGPVGADALRMAGSSTSHIDPTRSVQLRALATGLRASSTMVLLTLWADLLLDHFDRDQRAVVIGVPVSGRVGRTRREVVGLLMNTIPLVVPRLDGSLAERVIRVRHLFLRGLRHHRAPLTEVARAARPGQSMEDVPLYEAMFTQGEQSVLMLRGQRAQRISLDGDQADVPLSLVVVEEATGGIRISLDVERGTRLLGTDDAARALGALLARLDDALDSDEGVQR